MLKIVYIVEMSGEGIQFVAVSPEVAKVELGEYGVVSNWQEYGCSEWGKSYYCDLTKSGNHSDDSELVFVYPYGVHGSETG